MNLNLIPESQQFIQDLVTSGRFASPSEVVSAALEALRQSQHTPEFPHGELASCRRSTACGAGARLAEPGALPGHANVGRTAAELLCNLHIAKPGAGQFGNPELGGHRLAFGRRDACPALRGSDIRLSTADTLGDLPVCEPQLDEGHDAELLCHPL